MKIHGYAEEDRIPGEVVSKTLAEITVEATPAELRAMAAFLSSVADHIESEGSKFWHAHLSDAYPQFEESPHFVVFNLVEP
jgi:hypothetical protein